MSTATAEPPATEPNVAELTKLAAMPKADIAASFLGPGIVRDGNRIEAKPAPVVDPPKEEPKEKVEVPKIDPPKVDPPKTEPPAPKTKEDSIQDLRATRDQHAKDLETERKALADLRAEIEELKKQPAPKDFQEKMTALEKERDTYRQELRGAALERDPEFRKEYDEKINSQAGDMIRLMVSSGAPEAEAKSAVANWNESYFAEKVDEMDPLKRVKFTGAWQEAERLNRERQGKIQNAETEWQARQQQQETAQKQQGEEYQRQLFAERDSLYKELFATDGLRENADLQAKAREAVEASFAFTPRQIMHSVASARLLAESVIQKDGEIKELKEKHAALEKKAGELEEFVKNANGAVPRVGPSTGNEQAPDRKAIAEQFLNPVINR